MCVWCGRRHQLNYVKLSWNQQFLIHKNAKFIWFTLIWYRTYWEKEKVQQEDLHTWEVPSYWSKLSCILRVSFALVPDEARLFLCLQVFYENRETKKLEAAATEATVGQAHLLLLKIPQDSMCMRGSWHTAPLSPHSYVRSSMRAGGGQGCAGTNALARNKLLNETTIWRPLGGQTENVPSDSFWWILSLVWIT